MTSKPGYKPPTLRDLDADDLTAEQRAWMEAESRNAVAGDTAAACLKCKSKDGVRLIEVTVDGEPLEASVHLCREHSDRLIYDWGIALGALLR